MQNVKFLVFVGAAVVAAGCSPSMSTLDGAQKFYADRMSKPYVEVALDASIRSAVDRKLMEELRNPASAQLSGLRAAKGVYIKDGATTMVCGMINSENGFGGYTGFQPFYVEVFDDNSATLMVNNAMIYNVCSGAGIAIS